VAHQAYRFPRVVMNTAVDDGLIKRNPCRIKGAGSEDSPDRSTELTQSKKAGRSGTRVARTVDKGSKK
jgi:hypothetical protein